MDAETKIAQFSKIVEQSRTLLAQLNDLLPENYDCSYPVENGHGGDVQQSIGIAEECLDEALRGFLVALTPTRIYLVTTSAIIKETYEIEAESPEEAAAVVENMECPDPPVDTEYHNIAVCTVVVKEQ